MFTRRMGACVAPTGPVLKMKEADTLIAEGGDAQFQAAHHCHALCRTTVCRDHALRRGRACSVLAIRCYDQSTSPGPTSIPTNAPTTAGPTNAPTAMPATSSPTVRLSLGLILTISHAFRSSMSLYYSAQGYTSRVLHCSLYFVPLCTRAQRMPICARNPMV